jgi:hypothetical protein
MENPDDRSFRTWASRCLMLAVAGGVVCAVVAVQDVELLWHAYLYAFLDLWLVAMGATGLVALGNLTGGRWAYAGRPFYTAVMRTLPLVALLYVPIGLGLDRIYPWAHASAAAEFHFSPAKADYFAPQFYLGRAAGYFVAWLVVAWLLGRVSRWEFAPAETAAMRRVGALSLVVLVPTTTFAAFDWSMSLEPEWYSSIYGAICTAAGVLAAHALAILGLAIVASPAPREPTLATGAKTSTAEAATEQDDALNDMGNLMLAFLMVWAYFAFSQFLIIWSANLPSEISWYLRRLEGGWQFVAILIVLLNFIVPFLLLLSHDLKRTPKRIAGVALLLLAMYDVQMFWTVAPAFGWEGLWSFMADFAALAAVGGLWLAMLCWQAERSLLLSRAAGNPG